MVREDPRIGDKSYGIHEVYYTDTGKIENWTMDAIEPYGETPKELKKDLERMLKACSKKVLDYDRLTKQFRNRSSSKKKSRGIK